MVINGIKMLEAIAIVVGGGGILAGIACIIIYNPVVFGWLLLILAIFVLVYAVYIVLI
jgi:hypothetical protein